MGRPRNKVPTPKCKNGCRRVARIDGLCKICHAEISGDNGSPKDPSDTVEILRSHATMTPTEAENWGRLFAEFTAHKHAAQVFAYKQDEIRRSMQAQVESLEHKRQQQLAAAKQAQEHYEQVTGEICAKYKMERKYAIIDIDARVIREERPDQP